jgi:DNA-binding transcriptional regulator YiaG
MQERHNLSAATKKRNVRTFRGGEYVANLMAKLSHVGIAQRVKKAREEAGLKQTELADLLQVHWRTIQNWESQTEPIVAWDRLEDVAMATGVSHR